MARLRLQTEFLLYADIDTVWNFFSDVENLVKIQPPLLKTQYITKPVLSELSKGSFELEMEGLPSKKQWTFEYRDVKAQGAERSFVDIQLEGPFLYWKHQHHFRALEKTLEWENSEGFSKKAQGQKAGTWICDDLEYEYSSLPLLGRWMNEKAMKQLLEYVFAYRQKSLKRLLEAAS